MPVFPGGAGPNTFVPSFEDSKRLKFEYSRDPKKFPVLEWCAMKSVKRTQGKYLDLGSAQATRITSINDHLWAYGADSPDRNANLEQFEFKPFITSRYAFPFNVPYETAEEADWDLIGWQSRIMAQMAMTARTYKALSVATTSGNWSGQTASATTLGGKWSSASASNPYILTTLLTAAQAIHKATQGAVTPNMLNVIIDPVIAKAVRINAEVTDFVKQQQQAIALMENREFFDTWGIPKKLYGFNWVVEDAVRTTSKKGATDAKEYMLGGDTVIITANSVKTGDYKTQDDLPRGDDVGTFDTLSCFLKEDMTVETKNDQDNRRIHGRVVDNYEVQVTCPKSGYLVTDVL